nr:MAG TPA: hypothetical protein [Crassvirales sp.]
MISILISFRFILDSVKVSVAGLVVCPCVYITSLY